MAAQGTRPCAISRKLRVSHGCVSKILQRYAETGSIKPGSIGGSKPRLTTPVIEAKMDQYRLECPSILCYEIRRRLIDENVCDQQTAPSVSLIAKYLRKNESDEVAMAEKHSLSNSISEVSDEYSEEGNRGEESNFLANKNLANVISLTHSRRLRTSFSQKQIDLLESVFNHTHYPDANLREDIGQTTGLSDNKIQIWFSNRRAKWRKNSTQQQPAASTSVQSEQPSQFQSPINYLTNHLTINNVYTTPTEYQKQPQQPHQHNVFNINNAAPPNLMQTSSPILNNQFVTNQVVKPLINYSLPSTTTVSNFNVSQEAKTANLSGYQIDSSNPMTTPLFSSSSFNNNNNNININDNSTLGINNNFLIESTSSPSSSSSSSPAANQYAKSNPYYYQNNYGFYAHNTNNYTKEVGIWIIITSL